MNLHRHQSRQLTLPVWIEQPNPTIATAHYAVVWNGAGIHSSPEATIRFRLPCHNGCRTCQGGITLIPAERAWSSLRSAE